MKQIFLKLSVFVRIHCLLLAGLCTILSAGAVAGEKINFFQLSVATEGNVLHLAWDKPDNASNYWLLYRPADSEDLKDIKVLDLGNINQVSYDLWDGAAYRISIAAMDIPGFFYFSNEESFVIQEKPPVSESSLIPFSSEQEMLDYLKKGLAAYSDSTNFYTFTDTAPTSDNPAENLRNLTDSGDDPSKVFSTTNIQESGVDEADTIKTDGRLLYVIADHPANRIFINEHISSDRAILPDESDNSGQAIRILAISADPAGAAETGRIDLKTHDTEVQGLYLLTGREQDKPDLLITIGGQVENYWRCWYNPWCWNQGETEIVLYNVENPSVPEAVTRLNLDGQLISSRRIHNTLHLVTRYTPLVPSYNPCPDSAEEVEKNETLLKNLTIDELLPGLSVNGVPVNRMIDPATSYLPPLYQDIPPQPSLITITTIDLNDPSQIKTVTIAGPTETIYASMDTIYLASTRSRWDLAAPSSDTEKFDITTDIHKFDLSVQGPVYAGSGTVPGHLGWENGKKSFRMSHYQGVLRIATSLGQSWDDSARTRLTLLKAGTEENINNLVEVSHIDHIGEIGESLYAVRYVGSRAYMVTFRVTDPLYVFDLSDPSRPVKMGELHIEGYSDYLHPVDEKLLLGIGKDAVPDMTSSDFGGRGAWYQGLKMALFDVSDPAAPKEVKSMVIGRRGTSSAVLNDHHALAYLPPVEGCPARLALPVDLYDTIPDHDYFNPQQPWSTYDWTHTGLYLFEIDSSLISSDARADLRLVGTMVVESRQEDGSYPAWQVFTDRAVLLENSVHYVHNSNVWSAPWGRPENMTGPK